MAQIVKRKNKNGSASYLFRVSTGYDRNGKQVTTSRTFTPPPTLTGRKLEKEVRRRGDLLQSIHRTGQRGRQAQREHGAALSPDVVQRLHKGCAMGHCGG